MMQLHASCAKDTLSYEEADKFSSLMNTLFKADTSAETFMVNQNEEANKAIEFYEVLQRILYGFEHLEKETIISLCKSIYFGNNCIGMKIRGYIFYPLYLEALIKYISDMCSLNDVRHSIVDFMPWYDKPRQVDSKNFRKDFINIENLYNSIYEKKVKRFKKVGF